MTPNEIARFEPSSGTVVLEIHKFDDPQMSNRYWFKSGFAAMEISELDIPAMKEIAQKLNDEVNYRPKKRFMPIIAAVLLAGVVGFIIISLGGLL